jgi:hypothetical protein
LSNVAVQAFVRWIKDKPDDFIERARISRRLKLGQALFTSWSGFRKRAGTPP